jgi:hypothetical protein
LQRQFAIAIRRLIFGSFFRRLTGLADEEGGFGHGFMERRSPQLTLHWKSIAPEDALHFTNTSYKISDRSLTSEERAVAAQRGRSQLEDFCDRTALIQISCRNDRDMAEVIVAGEWAIVYCALSWASQRVLSVGRSLGHSSEE